MPKRKSRHARFAPHIPIIMLRTTIHPSYSGNPAMREFVAAISERFAEGELVQQGSRNTLRRFRIGDTSVVVKHFGVPNAVNRVAYTFLRKPKGVRAYLYALRLRAAGFDTPAPIAYVERRRGGLIADSYLITEECPYRRRFYEFGDAERSDESEEIVRAMVRRAAALHMAGILHRDFSPGNILFDSVDGEWRFAVVDINRMRFGSVSAEQGCRNFARLWGQLWMFRVIAQEYAAQRGVDPEWCFAEIRRARAKFWKRFAKRHKVKYRLHL